MALFGTGPALALDKWAIPRICIENKWHPATIGSIAKVESGGFGWFRNGQMKILPEPHVFRRRLPKSLRALAVKAGLATTSFKRTRSSGHYKRMSSPAKRYAFLKQMIDFCKKHNGGKLEPAYMSVSYGTYQIMGFNAKTCGFKSAQHMFEQFLQGEEPQLRAFVNFLKKNGLTKAIRDSNFPLVEKRYNGGGLGGVYAKRMAHHERKLKAGKWKNWDPNMAVPAPGPTKPVKDPDDIKVQGGLAGAATTAPTATAAADFPWETVLGVGGAVVIAAGIGYFIYTRMKDHGDAEKGRLAQPDDEVEETET